MKILVCDKTEADAIERMRAAGLQVDVRDDITPEELADRAAGLRRDGGALAHQGAPAIDRCGAQAEGDRARRGRAGHHRRRICRAPKASRS